VAGLSNLGYIRQWQTKTHCHKKYYLTLKSRDRSWTITKFFFVSSMFQILSVCM